VTAAVTVDDVSKRFRLYHEQNRSLKIALMRRRRASFEEFWALRHVDLEVPEGETFGLVGENGSGKSTLLKCMARILRPDEGRLTVDGKVSALLELGAGFHPELTGRENVHLNASILGLGKREVDRRFDDIVGFAGLERFIDTPVKNYSSGMYVRLGFSVAINVDPDVLLVDEVLAVGDEQFQRRCYERFADLKNKGRTIVVVSHALGLVRELCDTVAWLDGGQVKEVGAADDVVESYVGQVETSPTEAGETRWGSGEITVEGIELLDGSGQPVQRVRSGEPVTLRFRYRAASAMERPVFGVTIGRDGMMLAGSNTRDAGGLPERVEGDGCVDLCIDRLALLAGSYEVTPSIHDRSLHHAYDVRVRAFRFDVDPGRRHEAYGVLALGGDWKA
jgi:ABC-type polysaccharide/polyol phosphate transport system ATPase subunit